MPSEVVRVAAVHDGDSVRLTDDRRIRLIGINAPELARNGRPAEALAEEAGAALRQAVAGRSVRLFFDQDRHDRYGRTLAYLYSLSGDSMEAELLVRGLAFHIGVEPNLTLVDCLAAAEAKARHEGRGVWGHAHWAPTPAAALTLDDTGYQRVVGRITDISPAGGFVWLELDGPLVVQVRQALWRRFAARDGAALQRGANIEVRGWVSSRAGSSAARRGFKPLVVRLQSEVGLERLAPP